LPVDKFGKIIIKKALAGDPIFSKMVYDRLEGMQTNAIINVDNRTQTIMEGSNVDKMLETYKYLVDKKPKKGDKKK